MENDRGMREGAHVGLPFEIEENGKKEEVDYSAECSSETNNCSDPRHPNGKTDADRNEKGREEKNLEEGGLLLGDGIADLDPENVQKEREDGHHLEK